MKRKTNKTKEGLGRRPPTPLTGNSPGRRLPTLRDKVSRIPKAYERIIRSFANAPPAASSNFARRS